MKSAKKPAENLLSDVDMVSSTPYKKKLEPIMEATPTVLMETPIKTPFKEGEMQEPVTPTTDEISRRTSLFS